jgi:hypothetical protein
VRAYEVWYDERNRVLLEETAAALAAAVVHLVTRAVAGSRNRAQVP